MTASWYQSGPGIPYGTRKTRAGGFFVARGWLELREPEHAYPAYVADYHGRLILMNTRKKHEDGTFAITSAEYQLLTHCRWQWLNRHGHTAPAWVAAIFDHERSHAGRVDLISYAIEEGQAFQDALNALADANPEQVIELIESHGRNVNPEAYGALQAWEDDDGA